MGELRFLWIALNDSDEWGHLADYKNHVATLKIYQEWLLELFRILSESGLDGTQTSVIVTTDHGRGQGPAWKDHGQVTDARAVWMLA